MNSSSNTRPLLAVGLMLIADVAFAAMGALVKSACVGLPSPVVVLFRSLVIVVLAAALCSAAKAPFRAKARGIMGVRIGAGFVAMCAYFFALSEVPLATAVTLLYTAPIFVALLGALLLKEALNRRMMFGVAIAFVGAVLVAAPDPSSFQPVALAALFSAILAGVSYVAVRKLQVTDRAETIVFQFALWSSILASPALLLLDEMPTSTQWLGLLGVGVSAGIGQIFLTYSFRYSSAAYASAFSYGTVPFACLFGFLFFDESPGWVELAGIAAIVIAGVSIVVQRKKKPATA